MGFCGATPTEAVEELDVLITRARKLFRNSFSPRTERCLAPLQRSLSITLAHLNDCFGQQYSVLPYEYSGPIGEADITDSGIVVSAAYKLRQRVAGQMPEDLHDLDTAHRVGVLFTGIRTGELAVASANSRTRTIYAGVYLESVEVSEALTVQGQAPFTYFPLDSVKIDICT
jgi:hypothetical protein